MAAGNASFDEFASTTLKNYQPTLADNITNHTAFWAWMRKMKKFRTEAGGTSIIEPLLFGQNNTIKSYSRYEQLDTTPQEGISAAEYNWKQVAGSLTIDGFSEFINQASKTRVLNLLQAKITQLEKEKDDKVRLERAVSSLEEKMFDLYNKGARYAEKMSKYDKRYENLFPKLSEIK